MTLWDEPTSWEFHGTGAPCTKCGNYNDADPKPCPYCATKPNGGRKA